MSGLQPPQGDLASPLQWLLLAAAPALALLLALHPIINYDLGFHLRTGELVASVGIPTVDPFSFTVDGTPWFLEQWLGATAFWAVWRGLGIEGLVLFKGVVVAAAFLLLALTARHARAPLTATAAAGLLAAVSAEVRFRAQPFVLSFVGLALTLWMLERFRAQRSARGLWPLVPLFALWPHVHVGYLYGIAALGCYVAGAGAELVLAPRLATDRIEARFDMPAFKQLVALAFAASVVAPLSLLAFHPQGLGVLQRVWEIFASDFYRQTYEEMQSLAVAYGISAPLVLLWVLPPLCWLLVRRQLVLPHIILWALFVFTGVRVGRMVGETSLVLVPIWATSVGVLVAHLRARGHLARLVGVLSPRRLAAGLLVVTLLAGGNYVRLGWGRQLGWQAWSYPRACYEWVESHDLPPRMFNDMFFGGSFIFHFFPERRVFIDGRTVYPKAFIERVYEPIKYAAPGWQQIIDRAEIDWFLLTPRRFGRLHRALNEDPGWQPAHADETCVIYTRTRAGESAP